MSSLIVEVCEIHKVDSHPNADRLELLIIKGWQVAAAKGQFSAGDKVVYVPPDTIVPVKLSDAIGATKYLSKQRCRAVRLRGEMSFGLVFNHKDHLDCVVNTPEDANWVDTDGFDVVDVFGFEKWEPPVRMGNGEAERENSFFTRYTNIQNFRNFPNLFDDDTSDVVVTEKIHGTNSRVGFCWDDETGQMEFMVGSNNVRRKIGTNSVYEIPLKDNVKNLLIHLAHHNSARSVIMFSEIYGAGIQDLSYGYTTPTFSAFDIYVDGNYLDYDEFVMVCDNFGVSTVPVLYRGPFDQAVIWGYASGSTTISTIDQIREGVVVKPAKERINPKYGRVILKFISDDYLTRKGGTENH